MSNTTTFGQIDLSQLQTGMLINGEWRKGSSGSTYTLHDPATGQEIARVPQATAADVDAAVQAAKTALHHASWRDKLPAARERLLLKLADLLEQHADELARLETLNQGMLLGVAQSIDVGAGVQWLRYMAGWATKIHGDSLDLSFPFPPRHQISGDRKTATGWCSGRHRAMEFPSSDGDLENCSGLGVWLYGCT